MSLELFNLKGKIALVTGGSNGLGLSMAKGVGKAGATIVLNSHSSQQKLDNAIHLLKDEGINTHGYLFDVTKEDQVIEAISLIEACTMSSAVGA